MKKSTVRLLARSASPVCIARTSTNSGHVLAVCAVAHGDVLTLKATRDGQAVRDTVETFADALIGGWEFDYSAHVGAALDKLAAAKLLTR